MTYGLFDPDPEVPFWLSMVPTEDDLKSATEEQREVWFRLNAHVAFVHTAWAGLENALSMLFAAILRIRQAEASVILGSLTANRTKRDLIANCANLVLVSDARLKQVERLLRRTGKAASKRNFLAHGQGLYHQKYPDRVTVSGVSADLKPALHHYQSYAEPDLRQLRDTIDKIAEDLQAIAPQIWRARRRPLPQTPMQTEYPAPVFSSNIPQPRR